jgi:NAD(P)-dependent dehydrogenase (short-subunit alcohol dehydrogenase family)
MRTYVVTGSTSGIGLATKNMLESAGFRVIGVDRQEADVTADLSTPEGRQAAVKECLDMSGGVIDGAISKAGSA